MSEGYGSNAPALYHDVDEIWHSMEPPPGASSRTAAPLEPEDQYAEAAMPAGIREATPAPAPRTFAGLPLSTVILGALVLLMGLWSLWLTRELLVLRSHKTVSVSLATIVHDFIAAEAHNGGTAETSAVRTRLYLAATQSAIRALADQGQTVLVSEAVAGNSVPDVTPQLKATIDSKLRATQIAAATAGAGDEH